MDILKILEYVRWNTKSAFIYLFNPSDFPAKLPLSFLNLIIFRSEYTYAMLFAILPVTFIFSAIFPNKSSSTFSFIVSKLAFVALSISPN